MVVILLFVCFYVFFDLVSCLCVMGYAVCLVPCYVVAYLVTVNSVGVLFFAL